MANFLLTIAVAALVADAIATAIRAHIEWKRRYVFEAFSDEVKYQLQVAVKKLDKVVDDVHKTSTHQACLSEDMTSQKQSLYDLPVLTANRVLELLKAIEFEKTQAKKNRRTK